MIGAVDKTIANLRRVVSAETDAELARKLGIDKSTISGWRSRGRVPGRFVKLLEAPGTGVDLEIPQVWGELQERAQAIALVRFTLARADTARSGEIDRAMGVFLDVRPFWVVLYRAVHDLRLKTEALGVDLRTAQALLMQEDLRDPEASARRVELQLAEDIRDNPELFRARARGN